MRGGGGSVLSPHSRALVSRLPHGERSGLAAGLAAGADSGRSRLLAESARLGRTVADLLLPDRPVRGVTCGTIRPELRPLGMPCKVGGGNIDPTPI